MAEYPTYPITRSHLESLTGPLGIWQHASRDAPDTRFGYCTDDVARALAVDVLHAAELGWPAVRETATRSLQFLTEAFDPERPGFRNFRAADGSWLAEPGSEDCQGRALLALASAGVAADGQSAAADAPFAVDPKSAADPQFAADARRLFATALPVAEQLHALRASSSALIACDIALDTHSFAPPVREEALSLFERLATRLAIAFEETDTRSDWPWPEPVLTYENALLPRALLVASRRLGDSALRQTGGRVLDWLIRVQSAPDGTFVPVGSDLWWRRDGVRSLFDQQPIEATAMVLGCEAAFCVSADPRYLAPMEAAYGWFLGRNHLGLPVAVVETGGCHDGLTPRGVNLNQGAESTLMWQIALEHVRRVRRQTAPDRTAIAPPTSIPTLLRSRP